MKPTNKILSEIKRLEAMRERRINKYIMPIEIKLAELKDKIENENKRNKIS